MHTCVHVCVLQVCTCTVRARTHTLTHSHTHTHTHTQGALSVTAVTAATAAGYSALFLAHEEDLNWQTRKSVRACLVCTCTVAMREREIDILFPAGTFQATFDCQKKIASLGPRHMAHIYTHICINLTLSISIYPSIHPCIHPSMYPSTSMHTYTHSHKRTHTARPERGAAATRHRTKRRDTPSVQNAGVRDRAEFSESLCQRRRWRRGSPYRDTSGPREQGRRGGGAAGV